MAEKKYEYVCIKCGDSEWLQRWRYNQKKYPSLCTSCAKLKGYKKFKDIKTLEPKRWEKITEAMRRGGVNKNAKLSKKEKSEHAKKMRMAVKISGAELRARQQKFIDCAPVEYYEKYCEKRKQIALNFHAGMSDKDKEVHYRKVFKNTGRSMACDKFLEVLSNHKITHKPEQYVNGFIVDAIIDNSKLIIEFYGDIYHCNPRKFKDPAKYCSWISRTVQEQWNRDKRRLAALYKLGYKVLIVWEYDWNKTPLIEIERIKYEMHQNRIFR